MPVKTIGLILVAAALGLTIYIEIQKRTTFAKLEAYMREGDLEKYLKLLDRPVMRLLYPRYNILFMRLNATLALDDAEQTKRILADMAALKMSDEQRLALAIKAFSFYVEVEDKGRALQNLEYIEAHGDPAAARVNRRTYEIFLEGSSAYIDEMTHALEGAAAGEEAMLCQLIAIQHENRGDAERAAAYHERAKKVLDTALST